jgi:hypothetical protein
MNDSIVELDDDKNEESNLCKKCKQIQPKEQAKNGFLFANCSNESNERDQSCQESQEQKKQTHSDGSEVECFQKSRNAQGN